MVVIELYDTLTGRKSLSNRTPLLGVVLGHAGNKKSDPDELSDPRVSHNLQNSSRITFSDTRLWVYWTGRHFSLQVLPVPR